MNKRERIRVKRDLFTLGRYLYWILVLYGLFAIMRSLLWSDDPSGCSRLSSAMIDAKFYGKQIGKAEMREALVMRGQASSQRAWKIYRTTYSLLKKRVGKYKHPEDWPEGRKWYEAKNAAKKSAGCITEEEYQRRKQKNQRIDDWIKSTEKHNQSNQKLPRR